MFSIFKKKKVVPFSKVLDQMEDKIITDTFNCHFLCDRYWKVYEWDTDKEFYVGDEINVIEFYLKDNVHYRNAFTHTVH
jgi:hypothetical protein